MNVFREKQRFTYIVLITLPITVLSLYTIFSPMVEFAKLHHQSILSSIFKQGRSWVIILFTLFITYLTLTMKLITFINEEGVSVRFPPFVLKTLKVEWTEIDHYEVRSCDPLSEYGGWGYKGRKNNRAYNVSGGFGLQLILKDGRKIFIGSQKQGELTQFINALKQQETNIII